METTNYKQLEYKSYSKAKKEIGTNCLGAVASSAKIMHSLNNATRKEETLCIYLAPAKNSGYNTCPNSTYCADFCLYGSGHNMVSTLAVDKGTKSDNTIERARIRRTRLFFENRTYFVTMLVAEIAKAKAKAEKHGNYFSVRLNGTSDLSPEAFILHGKNILEIFPDVQFYDYTKCIERGVRIARKYANYDITLSFDGHNWDKIKKYVKESRVAFVYGGKKGVDMPEFWNGLKVVDGDKYDMRYVDEKNVAIALHLKKTANQVKGNVDFENGFVTL